MEEGAPQGPRSHRLLSNVYLDDFERGGHRFS